MVTAFILSMKSNVPDLSSSLHGLDESSDTSVVVIDDVDSFVLLAIPRSAYDSLCLLLFHHHVEIPFKVAELKSSV